MALRQYDFITGIETSILPLSGSPTLPNDTVTLDYAQKNFTPYQSWGANVNSVAALKAIPTLDRYDNQHRILNLIDVIYKFNSASIAVGDDDAVVQPSVGTGRWIKVVLSGGGGGGAAGVETLNQKLFQEQVSKNQSEPLDFSVGLSGAFQPADESLEAFLMADYLAAQTIIDLAWNPKFLNESDKNLDSATNWSAIDQASALSSDTGDKKIGTASIKFDKLGSGVRAIARYTLAAQTLGIANNARMWFYFKLTSITGLTNIEVAIYADSISNGNSFLKTTQYDGSALVVGWNKILVDLEKDSSSPIGTGWDISKLASIVEIGVNTSPGSQTYTDMRLDSVVFSLSPEKSIGLKSQEVTIFDNSNRFNVTLQSSNTRNDGPLTVTAIGTNITGGGSGSSVGRVKRSVLLYSGDNQFKMNRDALSGAIRLEQELRASRIMRGTTSGNFETSIDVFTAQTYTVKTASANTLVVTDPGNTSLDLLSTNILDIFRPIYGDYKINYEPITTENGIALSSSSSHSSGDTTLTATGLFGSVEVGDIVVKRAIKNEKISMVSKSANESFSDLVKKAAPDFVRLNNDSIPYPNSEFVVAHYKLGDKTQAEALKNRVVSVLPDLTHSGTVSTNNDFLKSRRSAGNFVTGSVNNRLSLPSNSIHHGQAQRNGFSLWFKAPAFTGDARFLFTNYLTTANAGGFYVELSAGANTVSFNTVVASHSSTGGNTIPFIPNAWNFVYCSFLINTYGVSQVNGTRVVQFGNSFNTSSALWLGNVNSSTGKALGSEGYIADFIIWAGGNSLTIDQCAQLYASGNYNPPSISGNQLQYRYTANGLSGQKLSVKASLVTSTVALTPTFGKFGAIKS